MVHKNTKEKLTEKTVAKNPRKTMKETIYNRVNC